jgi:hypothetical protein
MSRRRPWTVTSHDPIERLDDNLWTVEGDIPGGPGRRRMFIAKRSDGRLLFAGAAIPLDEGALSEVTRWGRPSFLVVPHHWHMIDAHPFAARLGLAVFGPRACATKIARRTDLAGILEDLPPDPDVAVEGVAGTSTGEAAVLVTSGGGRRVSVLIADVIQNSPPRSMSWPWRLLGFTGGPKVVPAFGMFFLRNRSLLKAQLERWAAVPTLLRLVPCHGTIVRSDAALALRGVAARL